jgi:hypothetical protein
VARAETEALRGALVALDETLDPVGDRESVTPR